MKILRLIGSMDPLTGGPCQGIRNSISELKKLGVYNEVACLDSPITPYLGQDPFIIHALGPTSGPWQYCPRLLPWLVENLSRFDVLIVHGLWLYPSYAARLARKTLAKQVRNGIISSVPALFIMPHGMLDPYFQNANTRRLKAVRNWIFWKLVEHKSVRDADGLLFTSETELQIAQLPFRPYQPKREINVGYGIQYPPPKTPALEAAFRKQCPTLGDVPYLLFLSRIHQKKGVDMLISAYAEVSKQWAQDSELLPKLVIAGPGLDTSYGLAIQKMVAELALPQDRILFPGMLNGATKWGAFYGCEAFILPSHQENFGIAVAEALACGKPVLISNQVNIWQTLENDGSGLVDDDTLAGTEQLLRQWLALTPTDKKAMGEKAKETFEHHFGIEQAALRFKEATSLRAI